jgi:predicted MFS family arabinose efflux permease
MKTPTAHPLPWALIGAACLGSFAATASGTTRAPFLIEMSHDLGVSMPLVANLVSFTATSWGFASAIGGSLSDRIGRRAMLIGGLFALALAMFGQAFAGDFFWVAVWATIGGACAGTFTGVVFTEVSARVEDYQRGRALGWVMTGQSLTLGGGRAARRLCRLDDRLARLEHLHGRAGAGGIAQPVRHRQPRRRYRRDTAPARRRCARRCRGG